MFDSFVFLPLSTRAYFKGRAYIKTILKNHARSYFAGRSYYRGNTVVLIFTPKFKGKIILCLASIVRALRIPPVTLLWRRARLQHWSILHVHHKKTKDVIENTEH